MPKTKPTQKAKQTQKAKPTHIRQTKRVIEKFKRKEAKCPSCKRRKVANKKLMKTRTKKSSIRAIRKYWKTFLQCESCMKKA